MIIYDPRNWFWVVNGDSHRAWSSASSGYVTEWDLLRTTEVRSVQDLDEVLRRNGLTPAQLNESDYAKAVQEKLDAVARLKGYADATVFASYVPSSVSTWANEARAFVDWRDAVWLYVYEQLVSVQSGQRDQPTIAELIDELPVAT